MERDIELLLDNCINEMRNRKSVDESIAEHPQYAGQLQPLLRLVQKIETLPQPEPTPEAISGTLINLGHHIAQYSMTFEKPTAVVKMRKKSSVFNIIRRPKIAWAFNAAFLFLVVLFSAATISANSVPGDFLYPLKLATEKIKFMLTFNSEKKAELRLTFSDKRLQEMIAVFQQSGKLDTTLLKEMLDEAKLALEETKIPTDTASVFVTKLRHVNAYQKDVLEKIRPQVVSSNRKIVDEAINMCDSRSRWMRRMMNEENEISPDSSEPGSMDSPQRTPRSKQKSDRRQWGPECDWMR
ncbi:DUF5667 domain-containing protein [Stygiobacter electus]|uniref:DUF5667 domain-containing protein n=1 Tax=Stygiobacter electus TaxID=3032292 RepID=A0AAE3TF61_9BACT|nr:DUF5667 domain-containing protein [Stygiobacter electus]MDF1613112.1 DUF5667 domain-containing protein [Stygiobacter electus]